MKVLQILILTALVCGFNFSVNAQADCRYGLKFSIQDESGKVIENAKLELAGLDGKSKLPSYVKLIRLGGAYVFTSWAGQTVNGNFQLIVSADGFEIYKQKVNFPICKIENYNVKLKRTTDKQNSSVLSGIVYDANGAVIVGAKVIATNEKGEKFQTLTNEEGVYVLNLSFNSYDSKTSFNFRMAKYEVVVDLTNQ